MKTIALPSGERVAALGQGAWNIGDSVATRAEEIATLRLGLDLGLSLIDTAEMYGDGRSEQLVAEAIKGRRDEVFLVSKVLPRNASRKRMKASCEQSLKHLATDRIDLYLLHWRGSVPLAETLESFMRLCDEGKIRHFGVSNLDLDDMQELRALAGGSEVAANQLLYNLASRGIEWNLAPALRKWSVPVMAYSPLAQGELPANARLQAYAKTQGMTAAQLALSWLLTQDEVIVIPKTGRRERLRENLRALECPLSAAQRADLDRLFPPPRSAPALEMR